ncbi:hypothetical protein MRX96_051432 [Rhipicephalus microplus]
MTGTERADFRRVPNEDAKVTTTTPVQLCDCGAAERRRPRDIRHEEGNATLPPTPPWLRPATGIYRAALYPRLAFVVVCARTAFSFIRAYVAVYTAKHCRVKVRSPSLTQVRARQCTCFKG